MKNTEIERRWRITKIDSRALPKSKKVWRILQGYLEMESAESSTRVRIVGRIGSMAVKSGKGLVRKEIDRPIPLDLAQAVMTLCRLQVNKTRTFIGPWELDHFHGPLKGVLILEREFKNRSESRGGLPSWVLEATEVTDILSNRTLAKLAAKLAVTGGDPNKAIDRIIARKGRP